MIATGNHGHFDALRACSLEALAYARARYPTVLMFPLSPRLLLQVSVKNRLFDGFRGY